MNDQQRALAHLQRATELLGFGLKRPHGMLSNDDGESAPPSSRRPDLNRVPADEHDAAARRLDTYSHSNDRMSSGGANNLLDSREKENLKAAWGQRPGRVGSV